MTRIAVVLLTAAVTIVFALLAAAATGTLAHIDGATFPAALMRAAAALAAVITIAAACAGVLNQYLA